MTQMEKENINHLFIKLNSRIKNNNNNRNKKNKNLTEN